jgi:hypothetical protein
MEHIGTLPPRRIHRNSQEFEFGSKWWKGSALLNRNREEGEGARAAHLRGKGGGRRRAAAGEEDRRREERQRAGIETESLWLGFGLEAIF